MKTLLLIPLLLLFKSATCQINLVDDLYPGPIGGDPSWITVYQNELFFYATVNTTGRELYKYDNVSSPSLVYDINPGSSNCISPSYYQHMVAIGNELYFVADNGNTGEELFKYDNVNAPILVADIEPGVIGSSPRYLTLYNSKIYFSATTQNYGNELWVFDPLNNSSQRISDINPGSLSSDIENITLLNNKIFFTAYDTLNGNELRQYDPTTNIVSLVYDIDSGGFSSQPYDLTTYNHKLYFSASTSNFGRELYLYDGVNTPQRLTDITSGSGNSLIYGRYINVIGFNGSVYFEALNGSTKGLYKFDTLTQAVNKIPLLNNNASFDACGFVVFHNSLYFKGNDNIKGEELWKYSPVDTPRIIYDLNPGSNGSIPYELTEYDNKLFFNATNGTTGYELFVYNDSLLSIQNISDNYNIKVYPQPCSNLLNISFDRTTTNNIRIELLDLLGKKILEMSTKGNKNSIQIAMNNIISGSYILKIYEQNKFIYSQQILHTP